MDENNTDRIAGTAMIVAAGAVVLAMAHHPTGGHGGAGGGGINGLVHGTMELLILLLAFGFARVAQRLGLGRPAVLAGGIAYAVSVFAHLGAATINGFAAPAAAAHGAGHDVLILAWEANQALAQMGVYATGAAYALWGADLLTRPGRAERLTGAVGIAVGLVPAVLLASGAIRMNVPGAMLAYAVHAGWAALAGMLLWRGRLGVR